MHVRTSTHADTYKIVGTWEGLRKKKKGVWKRTVRRHRGQWWWVEGRVFLLPQAV